MMPKAKYTTYPSLAALENARVLEASKLTYTQRFHVLMRLIKISAMIQNAKIVTHPEINTPK